MPRFAANLHYLFNEHAFEDRFAAAADAGFRGVEAQVPYDRPADALARHLDANGLEMALIDTPQGDWDAGERGLAALPGREAEFRDGIQRAAEYATALRCACVHVIAGTVPQGADRDAMQRTYLANLAHAAEVLAPHGIAAVIEPINPLMGVVPGGELYTTYGMRGFYLTRPWLGRVLRDRPGPRAAGRLTMRLLVLGARWIGGYFGGRLVAAGVDVTFLVRPGRAAALARDGLVVFSPLGDLRLPVTAVTSVQEAFDAVLLACKAYDLDQAAASVDRAVGPGTLVLPLLNGVRHLDVLDARFGPDRILGGLFHLGVTLT